MINMNDTLKWPVRLTYTKPSQYQYICPTEDKGTKVEKSDKRKCYKFSRTYEVESAKELELPV
jgi:hypothetical protein